MGAGAETPETLAAAILAGDRRALARGISRVEAGDAVGRGLIRLLYPRSGGAKIVGLTGPPGVGKSTLIAALAQALRQRGEAVGVIAVDPSSPITGGALLGDRVRLEGIGRDEGLFFRSLGSRGGIGALSRATADAAALLAAAGFPWVLVETVGAGQSEVAIMDIADHVVVVAAPGFGDEIQAGKAGLLEIAALVVVNQSDRDGADRTAAELEASLSLAARPVPVLKTAALNGDGLDRLLRALERLFSGPPQEPAAALEADRRQRASGRLKEALRALLLQRLEHLGAEEAFAGQVEAVADRRIDPYSAAEQLIRSSLFHKLLLQDSYRSEP